MNIKKIKFIKIFIIFFSVILIGFLFANTTYSVNPEEFLINPEQELRARNISKNIRCLVCQNQSIDDSSADLAKDLRIVIRNKIKENFTNKEIYEFLTVRYGDFILLKPPLKKSTIALWILPFALLFIVIFIIYWHNKNSNN